MSEKLQIEVDFAHSKAAENLVQLVAGLDKAKESTKQLTEAARENARVEKEAGETLQRFERVRADRLREEEELFRIQSRSVGEAPKRVAAIRAQMQAEKDAAEAARNNQAVMDFERRWVAEHTQRLSGLTSVTNALGTSVKNWIGAYAGLQGVSMIVGLISTRMSEIVEAQRKLAGVKWEQDLALRPVREQLGYGNVSEDEARKLVSGLSQSTGLTMMQAGNLISSASSFGFDIKGKPVEWAGKFAAPMGIEDKDQFDLIMKSLQGRNVSTESQAKDALGDLVVLGQVTGASNLKAATRAILSASGMMVNQGVPIEQAAAFSSAMISRSPTTPKYGADLAKQAAEGAQFSEPEARKLAAAAAAAGGYLPGYVAVTDQDFEASVAGGQDDGSQSIRRSRERIRIADEKAKLDEELFEKEMRRRRSAGRFTADMEADERRKRALDLQSQGQQMEDSRLDLKQREQAARSDMNLQRQLDEFSKLTLQQRMDFAISEAGKAKTPQQRDAFRAMVGGASERANALLLAAEPATQQRYQAALQALRSKPGNVMESLSSQYMETSPAQNVASEVRAQSTRANAADIGTEYATRLENEAAALAEAKDKASGLSSFFRGPGSGGDPDKVGASFSLTTTTRNAYEMARELENQAKALQSSLSPEDRAEFGPEVDAFANGLSDEIIRHPALNIYPPPFYRDLVFRTASKFGRMKAQIEAARKNRSKGSTGSGPTTQPSPTTQPTTQPISSAGWNGMGGGGGVTIFNYNPGVVVHQSGADDPYSLPGRLS